MSERVEHRVARERTDEEQAALDARPKPTAEQAAAVLALMQKQLDGQRAKAADQRDLPLGDAAGS